MRPLVVSASTRSRWPSGWSASSPACSSAARKELLIPAIGTVVLPYVAVVLGNVSAKRRTVVEAPAALESCRPAGTRRERTLLARRLRGGCRVGRELAQPRIHGPERVKVWLACDEHVEASARLPRLPGLPRRRRQGGRAGEPRDRPDAGGCSPGAGSAISRWSSSFAIACVCLAFWQIGTARRGDRARFSWSRPTGRAEAMPLADALPTSAASTRSSSGTPSSCAVGTSTDDQLLARGRPYGGNPGFEVLVPFQLEDGTVFIVDRGGCRSATTRTHPTPCRLPDGGGDRDRAPQAVRAGAAGAQCPEGHGRLDRAAGHRRAAGRTDVRRRRVVCSNRRIPRWRPCRFRRRRPEPDEGPHLSYAFQ